jgi:HEAT repeat protein
MTTPTHDGFDADRYRRRLIRRLSSLDNDAIELRVRLATADPRSTPSVSLADVVRQESPGATIALLGGPGSGKSTLARRVCQDAVEGRDLIVVLVELKRYEPGARDILHLIETQLYPGSHAPAGRDVLETPDLIVLDGLNEVPRGSLQRAMAEIAEISDALVTLKAVILVTCRDIDFPWDSATMFSRYEMVEVSAAQAVRYFGLQLGENRGQQVWDALPAVLRGLASTPLLLQMLTSMLRDGIEPSLLPRSRDAVYSRFLDHLDARTRSTEQVETPEDVREDCLAFLAYRMQNSRVEAPVRQLRAIVTEYFNASWGVQLSTFQHDVLDLPPMGRGGSARNANARRSFMHQSFQEYFTALHLAKALRNTGSPQLRIGDLGPYLNLEADAWRETIGFLSGMLPDSTALAAGALEAGNSPLAALCIEHASTVDPLFVDRFLEEGLDDFKYGGNFDYQNIARLMRVVGQTSGTIPQRVVADLEYWNAKYRDFQARVVSDARQSAELIDRIDGAPLQEQLDITWTLGERGASEGVAALRRMLNRESPSVLREHAVVALGKISSAESIGTLKRIGLDESESKWLRAYALHGMSGYRTRDTVLYLLSILEDANAKMFSEDAAWALNSIASANPELLAGHVESILNIIRASSDRYTQGCLIYTLASGHFGEAAQPLVDFLSSVSDPFVLEDGCHALGVLGARSALDLLSAIARDASYDAQVRRHAALALDRIAAADGH